MIRNAVHVTPSSGGWKVKSVGAERAAKITSTQAEAIRLGRQIATNRGAELIVHRSDGTVRSKDSYGNDPLPQTDH